MKWKKIKQQTLVIDAEPKLSLGNVFFRFKLEINHKKFIALYALEDSGNYLSIVEHGQDTHFFCPYCRQQSNKTRTCQALTDKRFEEILVEKTNELMKEITENIERGYDSVFEIISKKQFQNSVFPSFVGRVEENDTFMFGFEIDFEDGEHEAVAPYVLINVKYRKNEDNTFDFFLKDSMVIHNEQAVIEYEDFTLEYFTCECGYKYDRERTEKELEFIACNVLNDSDYKYWIFEVLSKIKNFEEEVLYAYKNPYIHEPEEKQAEIFHIEEHKKNEEK